MSEEPRKRSRFDQTEPPRKSRFDRRSRSPARGDIEAGRSRSPVVKSTEAPDADKAKSDAAAAAAAAAARINASISAKKGIQTVDVPPIRSTMSPSAGPGAAKSPSQPGTSGTLNAEVYTQDGDYIKDIEINDLRNRYTLTKGSTQKMIKEKTGADVTTRGNYYPDKTLATAANPPLFLHITSTTKDGLEKAVQEIDELMKHELPVLVDERRFRRRDQEQKPEPFERDSYGRRKWPSESIPIDLEPIPGFNLRAKVVGNKGDNVKHIQNETHCKVQIKGRGSGFMEVETRMESDEPMYLHVSGPDANDVERAKGMCVDLLEHIRQEYDAFKERGPPRRDFNRDSHGGDGDQGGYGQRDRGSGSYGGNGGGGASQYGGNSQYGGSSQYSAGYTPAAAIGYGGAQSPIQAQGMQAAAAAQPTMTPEAIQAWGQYYAANPSADPYAAYGGYAQVMASYMQGGYGYGQGQGTPQQQNGSAPPPPPPDDGAAPPPPPPPGSASGGYSAVPPPPGM
ncbi:hypothetical protein BAUCODRAFT_453311 [Baudoinia panamericana UAMH 10762]|uniref:K Homology domain-containing protein n=1 Tax=Baudoinia panamericana (strain UAMH 10762) TaxID=717646 RepID=M2LSM1_BAUPA|nr:uncharacterized protein BAUCODRAFT_453311 [Baudoinia panamericana UAMH 10762]EMC97477.1 hypothetical protein BAUCODRAFT_453311 [Baudoinia panamericana UAMH 10762]